MVCHALFWVLAELTGRNFTQIWSIFPYYVPIFTVGVYEFQLLPLLQSVICEPLVLFHTKCHHKLLMPLSVSPFNTQTLVSIVLPGILLTIAQLFTWVVCHVTFCFWNQSSHARGHEPCHHYIQPQQWGSRAGVMEFILNAQGTPVGTGICWYISFEGGMLCFQVCVGWLDVSPGQEVRYHLSVGGAVYWQSVVKVTMHEEEEEDVYIQRLNFHSWDKVRLGSN